MKKITIAIPTYNRPELLNKLLSSIPASIQISVSDNGDSVSQSTKEKYKNATFIGHKSVINMFQNWNSAIENAQDCEYIAIPSDDDLYHTGAFETINKYLTQEDADVFIFGNDFINGQDQVLDSFCPPQFQVLEPPHGLNDFLFGVKARMPSVFFKKSFLDEIGYFDSDLFSLTAADSELIQRALILGKVVYVPEIVSSYRVWEGSLTNEKIASQHWMKEIELWTDKLAKLGKEKSIEIYDWELYKDEIYATNMLAGLSNLYKKREYQQVSIYYKELKYPSNALIRTKIRIFKLLLLSKARCYV